MKMSDILGEQAIACYGDYEDPNKVSTTSLAVFEKEWSVVDTCKVEGIEIDYNIAKHKTYPTWEMGIFNTYIENKVEKDVFETVFRISMYDSKELGKTLGYPNLYQVSVVQVHPDLRGKKIAKTMYRYLVKNKGISMIGDTYQYFGARKLWASLSQDIDIQVDIVDYKEEKVVYRNVTLHHGQYDKDFDTRLWSYGTDKEYLRSVLVNI